MKIVVLTPSRVAAAGAGDFQQAVQTVHSLRTLGHEVIHATFGSTTLPLPGGVRPFSTQDLKGADVAHFMPGSPNQAVDEVLCGTAWSGMIACSTVYWDSLRHRLIASQSRWGAIANASRFVLRVVLAKLGLRRTAYECVDLLLPNSQAEAEVLRRFFRLPSQVRITPVPNGVPDELYELQLSGPESDVLLYPGGFLHRKNQLGFIRAMKHRLDLPVVFMGGPVGKGAGEEYFEQCRREAPDNWVFTGRVAFMGPEYLGWLSRARVACLTSSCETPGLALLESCVLGVRPVVTREGGTFEYYGGAAEYVDSTRASSIRYAVDRAWERGRLTELERRRFDAFRWSMVAQKTVEAYGCTQLA